MSGDEGLIFYLFLKKLVFGSPNIHTTANKVSQQRTAIKIKAITIIIIKAIIQSAEKKPKKNRLQKPGVKRDRLLDNSTSNPDKNRGQGKNTIHSATFLPPPSTLPKDFKVWLHSPSPTIRVDLFPLPHHSPLL